MSYSDQCRLIDFFLLYLPLLTNRGQKSEITNAILGLNLLYLLVENRLADFHCEVRMFMLIRRNCIVSILSTLLLAVGFPVGALIGRGEAIVHSHFLHTVGPAPCGRFLRPGTSPLFLFLFLVETFPFSSLNKILE